MADDANWIQVYGGVAFDLDNPSVKDITIDNISHSLSMLCRFGGHCKRFYSVAEHSVLCSRQAPERFKLEALLHDATEAYLIDLPTPIKKMIPEYKVLEKRIDCIIRQAFYLPEVMSPEVKAVDNRMLMTEKRQLMHRAPKGWGRNAKPYNIEIECWSPDEAHRRYLEEFERLMHG